MKNIFSLAALFFCFALTGIMLGLTVSYVDYAQTYLSGGFVLFATSGLIFAIGLAVRAIRAPYEGSVPDKNAPEKNAAKKDIYEEHGLIPVHDLQGNESDFAYKPLTTSVAAGSVSSSRPNKDIAPVHAGLSNALATEEPPSTHAAFDHDKPSFMNDLERDLFAGAPSHHVDGGAYPESSSPKKMRETTSLLPSWGLNDGEKTDDALALKRQRPDDALAGAEPLSLRYASTPGLIADQDSDALRQAEAPLAPLEALDIVGSYDSGGTRFTMYSDGSVTAQGPGIDTRFPSLEALRQSFEQTARG